VTFAFDIGDIVEHAAHTVVPSEPPKSVDDKDYRAAVAAEMWDNKNERRIRGVVLERIIQECHGGTQRNYLVSWIGGTEHTGPYAKMTHSEPELRLVRKAS